MKDVVIFHKVDQKRKKSKGKNIKGKKTTPKNLETILEAQYADNRVPKQENRKRGQRK